MNYKYDKEITELDTNTDLLNAEKKGMYEASIKIAKRLLGKLDIETIADVTELSIEEVEKLI